MAAAKANAARLEEDFLRSKRRDVQYITFAELPKIALFKELAVDVTHVPTLFCLNAGRDGRFLLSDLQRFCLICSQYSEEYRGFELESELKAYCTLQLWNALRLPQGYEFVQTWLIKLLTEGKGTTEFEGMPSVVFVDRNIIAELHQLLNIYGTKGIDLQTFFDLMQSVGENMGIMNLEEERFDDVAPLIVLELFIKSFLQGFEGLISELDLGATSTS